LGEITGAAATEAVLDGVFFALLHWEMKTRVEARGVQVRRATEADIDVLAEHRVALRIDEHGLAVELREAARDSTAVTYAELIATGEFPGLDR